VNLSRLHVGPVLDPIRALITCATGQDVDSVWVQGREVVRAGTALRADEDRLRLGAEGVYRSLVAAARTRDPIGAAPEELLGLDYRPPLLAP
jgi:5-methylthioadenosine/S-adenosylhomocysteine deaminase